MTGHTIIIDKSTLYAGKRRVVFRCEDCDLHGDVVSRPPEIAEALVADITAIHWGATGGDR